MAFNRLQRLGEAKFQRIINELMRGTPVVLVARLIQLDWKDCHDVGESTLAQQLRRLHRAITNGAFGGDLERQARSLASVRIKLFHGSSLNCLDELVEAAMIQKSRIRDLRQTERMWNRLEPGLSTAINDYRDLLLAIQKVKFDLGLDEYRRGIIRTTNPTVPDNRQTNMQVIEAVEVAMDIFAQIPGELPIR